MFEIIHKVAALSSLAVFYIYIISHRNSTSLIQENLLT